jgi:chromosomal replication initiator protein
LKERKVRTIIQGIGVGKMLLDLSQQGAWDQCKALLSEIMEQGSYNLWIHGLQFGSIENGTATLYAPNDLVLNWVEQHHSSVIVKAFQKLGLDVSTLEVCLAPDGKLMLNQAEVRLDDLQPAMSKACTVQVSQSASSQGTQAPHKTTAALNTPKNIVLETLHSRYNFPSFVVGNGNREAYEAARSVARSPGCRQLNPLIIYGGSGLGKTHLLHAVHQYASEVQTADKVCYVTSDDFLKDVVKAFEQRNVEAVLHKYSDVDMLLLDDIQFLAKGDKTQDLLRKIINNLTLSNKQVVITSDRQPGRIQELQKMLLGRFESGVSVQMLPPDYSTRIQILEKKQVNNNLLLPKEVLEYVANRFTHNVRELEGVLIKLGFYLRSQGKVKMDLETIKKILGEAAKDKTSKINSKRIMDMVAHDFGLQVEMLRSKSRTRSVVFPRQIAMYLCAELTGNTANTIGLFFDRDASTVQASVKLIASKLLQSEELAGKVNHFIAALKD